MQLSRIAAALAVLTLVGCDDDQPGDGIVAAFEEERLFGVWSGVAEITTAEDLASSINYPHNPGSAFPIIIDFQPSGRFTLITANYATSYDDEAERTCSGVFTASHRSVQFFAAQRCRALPMTKFQIGAWQGGINLEAQSNTFGNHLSTFATIRVRIRLSRE